MRSAIALFALPLAYAATIEVSVGDGGLVFKPDTVTASVGDVVKFNFYPQKHSVAQSTFDAPCQPRDAGIFSGYVSVTDGSAVSYYLSHSRSICAGDNSLPRWGLAGVARDDGLWSTVPI